MRFSIATIFSALAAMASANSIEFVNQDATTRTVIFTANQGLATIPSLTITGYQTEVVEFPEGWVGNMFSHNEGTDPVPGMLGEINFDGYAGVTYFDVSAIVNPNDHEGIKMMYPKESKLPTSGCQSYDTTCTNAYNVWDDVQTKGTQEKDLVCLLGNKQNQRRHTRDFVTGRAQ